MSHFGDYMDGVPVKISEKYKRPPRIELPYNVIECPSRAQNVVDGVKYCSTFERNVLTKLKELRSAKETRKNERRHRLQLLEEVKQKKLDALAVAEEEERLKQLSVSEVSYPSTDEISALSPDEKVDKCCDTNLDNNHEAVTAIPDVNYHFTSNTQEPEQNILQPIQVKSSYVNNLLDDPDPLQELKRSVKVNKIQYNRNVDTLTFRDFEHDTSSPFDNVELKTINDMELLAQVLQSQRVSTTSCNPGPTYISEQTSYALPNCASQVQIEYLPNTYMEQPIQGQNIMYSAPQQYGVSNGYYIQKTNENVNMYMPNYQYYIPNNQYTTVDQAYYGNPIPTTSGDVNQVHNGSTYIPHPYYFQYPQIPVRYQAPNNYEMIQNDNPENQNSTSTLKSRSRSVPDIVKELNDELASAKLRANERSYNVSPAPKVVPRASMTPKKEERRSRKKSEKLPNPFDKMSPEMKVMCQKIHGMGFPLDRVARVCSQVGENDKKVIEVLLILGELIDLGFPEGRALTALVNFEFNKDKALDELVSYQ